METGNMVGIYAIENRLNKKMYVGLSKDILKRWSQHLAMLEQGIHHSFDLQADYDELGLKHFAFYVLELCKEDKLREREVYWITKYNAEVKGYNRTAVGYKPHSVLVSENEELQDKVKALTREVKQLKRELNGNNGKKPTEQLKKEASRRSGEDNLLEEAKELVIKERTASVSLLQRRLGVGYTRAARLIDKLEKQHVVGPYMGSAPRVVLVHRPAGSTQQTERQTYRDYSRKKTFASKWDYSS